MKCDVAREALSARIDGEAEPVPAARVDEHLTTCTDCRSWFDEADRQAKALRDLARTRPVLAAVDPAPRRVQRRYGRRWALAGVGIGQLAIAGAQALGLDVGFASHHGMAMTGHLLNEWTAWSLALGVAMIAAARWRVLAAGLTGVLAAFAVILLAYVIADAVTGAVTVERVLTHVPVVAGMVLALSVWRTEGAAGPPPEAGITLPGNATRGRRRSHLWPTDNSAA